jgi:hypothetical protein
MLAFDIKATVTEDSFNARAEAAVKATLPTAGTATVQGVEAAREQVHARLRQVGREMDEQLDALAAKARAVAADRESVATPGVPVDVPF